jgi:hypothetical protein
MRTFLWSSVNFVGAHLLQTFRLPRRSWTMSQTVPCERFNLCSNCTETHVCFPTLLHWCPQHARRMWMVAHSFVRPLRLHDHFRIPNTISAHVALRLHRGYRLSQDQGGFPRAGCLLPRKERITNRTSSFVHSFSTVATVHLTLRKGVLSTLVNKFASWYQEERKTESHNAVSSAFTEIK